MRLTRRDRIALAHRVIGAAGGLALVAWAFATSSWSSPWVVGAFALVTIGGPASYHGLTSIVSCPGCGTRLRNFRIGGEGSRRKVFRCEHCSRIVYLTEGFRWQRDASG